MRHDGLIDSAFVVVQLEEDKGLGRFGYDRGRIPTV